MLKTLILKMSKPIFPCLWFDSQAKEAAEFYCSVFENSKILESNDFVTTFEINNTKIMALNGGPRFTFNESISLVVECATQQEIDTYWDKLTLGGEEGRCGWLKDKFGLSWQIVPSILKELLSDPGRSQSVMAAFMEMKKFDIQKLIDA